MYHWIREAWGGRPHVAKSGIISDVTKGLRISLEFFIHILKDTEPVVLNPMARAKVCKVFDSDAECSERSHLPKIQEDEHCSTHSTGMGAIVFAKPRTSACCGEAPRQIERSLLSRETQNRPGAAGGGGGGRFVHFQRNYGTRYNRVLR